MTIRKNPLFSFYTFNELPEGATFSKKDNSLPEQINLTDDIELSNRSLAKLLNDLIGDPTIKNDKKVEDASNLINSHMQPLSQKLSKIDPIIVRFHRYIFGTPEPDTNDVQSKGDDLFKPTISEYINSDAFNQAYATVVDALIAKIFVSLYKDYPLIGYLKTIFIIRKLPNNNLDDETLAWLKTVNVNMPEDLTDFYGMVKNENFEKRRTRINSITTENPLEIRKNRLSLLLSEFENVDDTPDNNILSLTNSIIKKVRTGGTEVEVKDIPFKILPKSSVTEIKKSLELEVGKLDYEINRPIAANRIIMGGNGLILSTQFNNNLPLFNMYKPLPLFTIDPSILWNLQSNRNARCLGKGHFYYTEETLVKYEGGEIAHIENVMKGERKLREHTRKHSTETFEENVVDQNNSSERDITTNDQFELKEATKQELAKDVNWGVEGDAHFRYGTSGSGDNAKPMIELNVSGKYESKTHEETTKELSSAVAKSIIDKSVEKIEERIHEKRTKKIFDEIIEFNSHELNNSGINSENVLTETEHISGIYQWVNKIARIDLYTYDNRMQYEFVIPEPSVFYLYALANRQDLPEISEPQTPKIPVRHFRGGTTIEDLKPDLIKADNYSQLCADYNVTGVVPPPVATISHSFSKSGKSQNSTKGKKDEITMEPVIINEVVKTPTQGYEFESFKGNLVIENKYVRETMDESPYPIKEKILEQLNKLLEDSIVFSVGEKGKTLEEIIINTRTAINKDKIIKGNDLTDVTDDFSNIGETLTKIPFQGSFLKGSDSIPINVVSKHTVYYSLFMTFELTRTDTLLKEWQQDVYDHVMNAYKELKFEYDAEIREYKRANSIQNGITIDGNNPLTNKEIVLREIKRQCIYALMENHFDFEDILTTDNVVISEDETIPAMEYPIFDLEKNSKKKNTILFWEQAFEWHLAMFKFLPYYWADKNNWLKRMQAKSTDPAMQEFLQAGAVRVVVPVRPGYENQIGVALLNNEPWAGGEPPLIGDSRYLEVYNSVKEEREVINSNEEGRVLIDSWDIKIPTSLVILRDNVDKLPVFIE